MAQGSTIDDGNNGQDDGEKGQRSVGEETDELSVLLSSECNPRARQTRLLCKEGSPEEVDTVLPAHVQGISWRGHALCSCKCNRSELGEGRCYEENRHCEEG